MAWELSVDDQLNLTQAKARLSDLVRRARTRGETTTITVDGEPAARLVPVDADPRDLTPAEVATSRALLAAIARLARAPGPFGAVALLGEGRR